MSDELFIARVAEAIECDVSLLTMQSRFKDIENWDSMAALSVIAMADEFYGKSISGEDLKSATTVADLLSIISK